MSSFSTYKIIKICWILIIWIFEIKSLPILFTYRLIPKSVSWGKDWQRSPISLAPSFVILLLINTRFKDLSFFKDLLPSSIGLIPVSVKLLWMNDKYSFSTFVNADKYVPNYLVPSIV